MFSIYIFSLSDVYSQLSDLPIPNTVIYFLCKRLQIYFFCVVHRTRVAYTSWIIQDLDPVGLGQSSGEGGPAGRPADRTRSKQFYKFLYLPKAVRAAANSEFPVNSRGHVKLIYLLLNNEQCLFRIYYGGLLS